MVYRVCVSLFRFCWKMKVTFLYLHEGKLQEVLFVVARACFIFRGVREIKANGVYNVMVACNEKSYFTRSKHFFTRIIT